MSSMGFCGGVHENCAQAEVSNVAYSAPAATGMRPNITESMILVCFELPGESGARDSRVLHAQHRRRRPPTARARTSHDGSIRRGGNRQVQETFEPQIRISSFPTRHL